MTNNYLEAASENFLLGGADPAIPNLIPSDITFTKNYVTKPLSWRSNSDINVKNLFELKNGARVFVDGNIFENNWLAAQAGYSIVLTGRSQDGLAPWSIVRGLHVHQQHRPARRLGHQHPRPGLPLPERHLAPLRLHEQPVLRRERIDLRRRRPLHARSTAAYDITVDHNTVLQDGNSVLYADTNPVQRLHDDQQHRAGQRVGHHGRRHLAGQRHDCHLLPELDVPARRLGGWDVLDLPDRQLLPGEHGRRRLRRTWPAATTTWRRAASIATRRSTAPTSAPTSTRFSRRPRA